MYDYIVVGAGSTGATLASRLSEDPATRVLLLEAGPDYRSADAPAAMRIPNPHMIGSHPAYAPYRYGRLTAQRTSVRRPAPFARGRGMGGCSAIGAQIAIRGIPEDFDAWVAAGADGWGWADVLPAFIRLERDLTFPDAPYHGADGPIPIYRAPQERWGAVDRALATAALDLGYPWHDDHNAPDATGVSPYAIDSLDDVRVSTNDAYLEPARGRENLTIMGDALVDRVLFEGARATGVLVRLPGAVRAFAAREVVVAAGVIHTPGILVRSGIGPLDTLLALGIAPVADLPVGRGLVDHYGIAFGLKLKPEARAPSVDFRHTNVCVVYSSNLAGAGRNDMFIGGMNINGYGEGGRRRGLLTVATFQTFSRGEVRVVSTNPNVDPEIDCHMLDDERDRVRLKDGMMRLMDIARHPAIAALHDGFVRSSTDSRSITLPAAEEFDDWLSAHCQEIQHAVGSCRMGRADDPRSVVDPDCRVIGVEGLRVIDASIMPEVPRANPHLTAVMIGEHMAARLRARTA